MKTPSHKGERSQPETRKQVRDAAAKICAAMDSGVMDEAANFVEWWTSQQSAHYRLAASGESNPAPLPNEWPRPAN
jgi:hypothetical protein